MTAPILATKLHVPRPRANIVSRARLSRRLDEALRRTPGVILISAPAGFGKSTLISEWAADCRQPLAWLSLDAADSDPARFLIYFIAALQTVHPGMGEKALAMLRTPQPPPAEAILTSLLNEIASAPDDFILILDDFHAVDSGEIDRALSFLVEHLPVRLHLVIATREDPDLPLARLRARDQLTELRVNDLRFETSEAADFLNRAMDLGLAADDVAALEARTEGWIAGLHLAAISLQGRADSTDFIRSFSGSHRFVMDFLVEEVLKRQPEPIQAFLLQTSILARLCGPLCDAVLSDASVRGQETLEHLERLNLMIVPLDEDREWYRYHHLFADVLQAHLMREQSDRVRDFHRRASAWLEWNGYRPDAIRHALAAADFDQAADLIELEWSANSGSYFRNPTWLGWVRALPDELIRSRPRLGIGLSWELLHSGELEAAELRMREVEGLLEAASSIKNPAQGPSAAAAGGEARYQSLRAALALARAFHAQALGDIPATEKHARQVLALVPESNEFMRGLAGAQLSLARWSNADLETAFTYMTDGMASLRRAGAAMFANSGTFVLAEIRIAQGRLLDAIAIHEQALQLVSVPGEPLLPGTAELHLGLSELHLERGEIGKAGRHLQRAEDLGKTAALDEWPYRLHLSRAHLREAQGDLEGALDSLDEAERLHQRSPLPDIRPVAALKARIWIRQGRLNQAIGWAELGRLSAEDDPSYVHEFEHVTLARLLLARQQDGDSGQFLDQALRLLDSLGAAAEDGGRLGSLIEILVLQALAHQAKGNLALALRSLERALTLGEPEGYFRVFVAEGRPMYDLLSELDTQGTAVTGYVAKLLTSLEEHGQGRESSARILSERELDVLRLIAQGLSNDEIGKRLHLALDTVKGHNRRIFNKLQVQRRTEAVARARELGLL